MRRVISVWLALSLFGCPADPKEDQADAVARDAEADGRVVRIDMAPIEDDAAADAGGTDADKIDDAATDAAVDAAPQTACANGLDDDRDGVVDADDPGCTGPEDDDEFNPPPGPACDDREDNDGDALIDLDDPDCSSEGDPTEDGGNPLSECSNGIDDDENGFADWPFDPGCHASGDATEGAVDLAECANGVDDDEDGIVDHPSDPGCAGRGDRNEEDPDLAPACANGADDDANGRTDWPDDSGCDAAGDPVEQSPCGEGTDLIDLNAYLAENAFYDGTLEGAPARSVGSCGGAAGGEQYFVYRVERPLEALRFSTNHAETFAPTVLYLRSSCLGPADTQCDRGTAERPGRTLEILHPPPGVYFLVVDTGSRERVGAFRLTVEAVGPPHCRDMEDNDGDGLVDVADPGCEERDDADEADPPAAPVCNDTLDNDMDGAIDWPADMDCAAAGAGREEPLCPLAVGGILEVGQRGGDFEMPIAARGPGVANGACEAGPSPEILLVLTLDDPSDVTVDVLDGGISVQASVYIRQACEDPASEVACKRGADLGPLSAVGLDRGVYFIFVEQGFAAPETARTARVTVRSNIRACNNLLDDDEDGRIDRDDPGCTEGLDDSEINEVQVPECADGRDNDNDGTTDWPNDDGCIAAGDPDEAPLCMLARDITVVPAAGGRFDFDTRNHQNLYGANCGGEGPEQIFSITLPRAAVLTVEVVAADYDTLMFARSSCDDPGAEIGCDDDGSDIVFLGSLISANVPAGTYFVFIDGFGGDSGTGTLQFTVR